MVSKKKKHTLKIAKNLSPEEGNFFNRFSKTCSEYVGHPVSFFIAILLIVIWLISGPVFSFSDTWQLIINTGTTIITFLIVFLIQNTQNRDVLTIQLKLDELIKSHSAAKNSLINLDTLSDAQIKKLEEHYKRISKEES